MAWLKQYGWRAYTYGEAELLAQAKNVTVENLRDEHALLTAQEGEVRLMSQDEYSPYCYSGNSETAWAGYFRMAWHMGHPPEADSVKGAGKVAREMDGETFDAVKRMEHALYNHYDRRGDAKNAHLFNTLGAECDDITAERNKFPVDEGRQIRMIRK